jgi:hypothetical protein
MEFAVIIQHEFAIGHNRSLNLIDTLIANGYFQYVKTEEKTKYKLIRPTNVSEVENHIFQTRVNKARLQIEKAEEVIMDQ